MKLHPEIQWFARMGRLKIAAFVFICVSSSLADETNAVRQHNFAKIRELTIAQNYQGFWWLESDSWSNWGIDCAYEPLPEKEQAEINHLALGLAKNLSLHATVNIDEADKPLRPQGDYSAIQTIHALCVLRVVNDPEIIPPLIDTLRHRNDTIADNAHGTLRILTRRMFFEQFWRTQDKSEIKSWWEQWWKANKAKHPVFDVLIEMKAKAEVVRLVRVIEKEVKPKFPELNYFRPPEKIDYPFYTRPIFRIVCDPQLNALVSPKSNQSYLEIICNFESPDSDGKVSGERGDHGMLKRPKDVAEVYRHKLPETDILIVVRVGSSNTNLLTELKNVLSPK